MCSQEIPSSETRSELAVKFVAESETKQLSAKNESIRLKNYGKYVLQYTWITLISFLSENLSEISLQSETNIAFIFYLIKNIFIQPKFACFR